MKNHLLGSYLVFIGLVFLMIVLFAHIPYLIWDITLGASIILNITGTVLLMKHIKFVKTNNNVQ
ncbi:hypothetical protein bcgnr5369_00280 [Bacillus cereus]